MCREMDEAFEALAGLDVERLEAAGERVQGIMAGADGWNLAGEGALLPRLLQKQATLGQLLHLTAANLRVLTSLQNVSAGDVSR